MLALTASMTEVEVYQWGLWLSIFAGSHERSESALKTALGVPMTDITAMGGLHPQHVTVYHAIWKLGVGQSSLKAKLAHEQLS